MTHITLGWQACPVVDLVTIVGPLASGKNTVAKRLADLVDERGATCVVVDIDDVAAMVGGRGAGVAGLWPAAHEAHGALVAGWLRTAVDLVIAIGNVYDAAERRALEAPLPPSVSILRVVLDAPIEVTWARASADPERVVSRQRGFHERRHARFRAQLPEIPADLTIDTSVMTPDEAAGAILSAL